MRESTVGYRFFICLLALLLVPLRGNSRTPLSQAKILLKDAQIHFNWNYPDALALALQARQRAIDSDETGIEIKATCIAAAAQANTNQCKEALQILDQLVGKLTARQWEGNWSGIYAAKAICWLAQGNYDSAKLYQERALTLGEKGSVEYAYDLISVAKVYIKTGNPERALEQYQEAIRVFNSKGDKEGAATADDLLGEVYYAQHIYDKAFTYFRQSLAGFRASQHKRGEASALLHMGNLYYMQMKDDSATAYYTSALNTYTSLGDHSGMAICYNNLSRVLLETGKTDDAIVYANKALATITPGNYITTEAGTYQHLGDIYAELKQYDKAIAHVQKALHAARSGDNKVIVRDCYKSLSEIYEAMKQPQLAMENLRAAYRIKDSVMPANFNRQLAEMETKYKTEKKETEIQLLRQQQQIDALNMQKQAGTLQKQRFVLLLLAVLIVVTIVATYQYIARRKQQEAINRQRTIQETEEHERMRIAKDIHDELGSGLSKIRFLSELANTQSEDQQRLFGSLHSIADTSKGLVENMRDLVWAMNPENTTLSNLVARVREYSHDYMEEFPIELEFDIPDHVPAQKISKEVNRNVSMIVKESLQNIVKHAGATKVTIRIAVQPKFRLEIADNGRGYDHQGQYEGNGLKNMAARSQALGAVLTRTSVPGQGSRVSLEFALEQLA